MTLLNILALSSLTSRISSILVMIEGRVSAVLAMLENNSTVSANYQFGQGEESHLAGTVDLTQSSGMKAVWSHNRIENLGESSLLWRIFSVV